MTLFPLNAASATTLVNDPSATATTSTTVSTPAPLTAAQKAAKAKAAAKAKKAAIKAKKLAKAKKLRANIIKTAKKYRGIRYVYAGSSPKTGFDCSGFTQYVFKKTAKVNLPHSANGQAHRGRKVSAKNAKPGDLVVFSYPYMRNFHVGIYVDKNHVIGATKPGKLSGIADMRWSGVSHTYIDIVDPKVGL